MENRKHSICGGGEIRDNGCLVEHLLALQKNNQLMFHTVKNQIFVCQKSIFSSKIIFFCQKSIFLSKNKFFY